MAEKKSAPATQLDAVLAQIRKEFGETAIMRLGDTSAALPPTKTSALQTSTAMPTARPRTSSKRAIARYLPFPSFCRRTS